MVVDGGKVVWEEMVFFLKDDLWREKGFNALFLGFYLQF